MELPETDMEWEKLQGEEGKEEVKEKEEGETL